MEGEPVKCPPELANSITPGPRCQLPYVFSYLPPASYRFLTPPVSQLRFSECLLFHVVFAWYIKNKWCFSPVVPKQPGDGEGLCQRSVLPTNAKGVLERDLTAFCHRAAVHCRLLALTSPPSITMRQFCVRASSCPLETTLDDKGLNFRSSTRQRTEMKPMHVSKGKNWSRLWIFYREVGIKDALVSFADTCILPNDTQHVYWAVRS